MKKIIIVDVPDGYGTDRIGVSVALVPVQFYEFTPPTDAEIEAKALEISRKYGIEGNAVAIEMSNWYKNLMR